MSGPIPVPHGLPEGSLEALDSLAAPPAASPYLQPPAPQPTAPQYQPVPESDGSGTPSSVETPPTDRGVSPWSNVNAGFPTSPYGFQSMPPIAPHVEIVRHTLTRRNWLLVVMLVAVLAGAVGAAVGAVVGVRSQRTIVEQFFPNKSALAHPQDIQAVLAKVEPAVVSIDSQAQQGGDIVEAAGSGMVLTPQGEVLTNNHVVAGATTVTVTLYGQSSAHPAKVIGTDPGQDLALVQIQGVSNLPTVTLGDSSSARVGDSVLAIGNALALAGGPSVTQGIVSAENRSLTAQNDSGGTENLTGLLQTDAAINPGNSGGPLVNSQAQVIGMNTAVASSSSGNAPAQNIGFAIAIDSVKPLLPALLKGGTGGPGTSIPPPQSTNSAYIGVTVVSVTPTVQTEDNLTPSSGALIVSVESGSPGDKAGIQPNDVVVSLNGKAITTAQGLTAALHPLKPGDVVKLGIYRGSTKMTISVTLGTRPAGG